MPINDGNAGEWAEPYVLLELLYEGKIYKSDENLNVIKDVWHDISSIIFKENRDDVNGSLQYLINPDNKAVSVVKKGKPLVTVKREEIGKYAKGLRKAIQDSSKATSKKKGGVIDVPSEYIDYVRSLGRESLTASSKSTPDIWLNIPDVRNNTDKPLGFSIKSIMASPPTIFNSSGASNIMFEVTGVKDQSQIDEINKLVGYHEDKKTGEGYYYADYSARIKKFKEYGFGLKYASPCKIANIKGIPILKDDHVFEDNLKMVDSRMPEMLGYMVAEAYFNKLTRIPDLVDLMNKNDPLEEHPSENYPFYTKKVKDLLVAMTLSMTAATAWDGSEGTNGGLIIVKENGDVVCYHIFDRNDFRDFLFRNMRFEHPSNARQLSMSIIEDGSKYYTLLNVQIRFDQYKSGRSRGKIKGYYDLHTGSFVEKGGDSLDDYFE